MLLSNRASRALPGWIAEGCPRRRLVGALLFLQAGLEVAFYPGSRPRGGDWRRWFRARSSGTAVRAGRNHLCYNFLADRRVEENDSN